MAKSAEFEGQLIQIDAMKVMPLCLCVVRRGGKGCCLRWCAFVQSCTVSVQLHPWFGLGVLEPTSAVQWMERQSLFLCLCQRSLLCLEPKDPSSCSNPSPQPPRPVSPTLVFQHPSSPALPTAASCPCANVFFLSYKTTLNLDVIAPE